MLALVLVLALVVVLGVWLSLNTCVSCLFSTWFIFVTLAVFLFSVNEHQMNENEFLNIKEDFLLNKCSENSKAGNTFLKSSLKGHSVLNTISLNCSPLLGTFCEQDAFIMASIITFWHQDDNHTLLYSTICQGVYQQGKLDCMKSNLKNLPVCLGSELNDKNCYCWGCGIEGTFLSGCKHWNALWRPS